jgi:hypothetical protein
MVGNSKEKYNLTQFNEKVYLKIGSKWFYDGFYLYILLPWAIMNTFLNLISFYILNKMELRQNAKKLYIYLKIYLICCAIMSIGGMTMFVSYSPLYVSFGLSYFARLLRCQINLFLLILLHFYAYILDILIISERLSQFSWHSSNSFIKRNSPYKIAIIAFILCTLINMPSMYWHSIKTDEEFIRDLIENPDTFSYCSQTKFASTPLGAVLSLSMLAIKDIFTLFLEIILNIILIVYYVKFLRNKSRIQLNGYIIIQRGKNRNRLLRFPSSDKNLFFLTILFSMISFFSHFFSAFSTLLFISYKLDPLNANLVIIITSIISSIKYFSNFWILFIFNMNFRSLFFEIIRLRFT